jgi:hypothetical protein
MDWSSIVGPLLQSVAPTIAKALLGQIPIVGPLIVASGGVDVIAKMVAKQFGVEATPEAIDQAIKSAPPEVAQAKLAAAEAEASEAVAKWQALVEIAVTETEAFKAGIADNEAARQQNFALQQAGSPLAWAPAAISVLVIVFYGSLLIVWIVRPPSMSDAAFTVLNMLIGVLVVAFGQVINFYLGSSASSRGKDAAISAALTSSQASTSAALKTTSGAVSSVAKNAKAPAAPPPLPNPAIHARRD